MSDLLMHYRRVHEQGFMPILLEDGRGARIEVEACVAAGIKAKAFTLIELLVVIAIIAILSAILLPSLRHARDTAKTVVCKGNLRQLSLAYITCTNDNNGKLPGKYSYLGAECTKGCAPNPCYMWYSVSHYAGYHHEGMATYIQPKNAVDGRDSVWFCPSNDLFDMPAASRNYTDAWYATTYAINFNLQCNNGPNAYYNEGDSGTTYRKGQNRISHVRNPSRVPALGDSWYYPNNGLYQTPYGNYFNNCRQSGERAQSFAPKGGNSQDQHGSWHKDKSNFAFLDGHVNLYGYEDIGSWPSGWYGFFSFNAE